MSFDEVQFPTDISYGASGGATFCTEITETYGGFEQRNQCWPHGRGKWNVAHGVKTRAQLDALIAFFRARRGKARGFRFKDWSDYSVTAGSIGTGNGSTTTFQLKKIYTSGGQTVERVITKPVSGTINIYKNGVLQSSGVTVSTTTGVVTFTTAPANGVAITADFQFDVPVRFDTDEQQISVDFPNGVGSWTSVPIVEIRI
jgi:uncharacterized protein (TIGR02217 family)